METKYVETLDLNTKKCKIVETLFTYRKGVYMKKILLITLLFGFCSAVHAEKTLTQKLNERKMNANKKRPSDIKKIMDDAQKDLADSKIAENAIKKGSQVPEFKIANKNFSDFYKDKPVILKFYRGSWCPYCQIELKDYQKFAKEFSDKGYQVLIITPDNEKEIKKFKSKNDITFAIYSDKDNTIAKKMGVAFKVNGQLNSVYKKFGIDLVKSQGNSNNELPLPGTYVVDKNGRITYSFVDIDYTKRLDPRVLLKNL